MGNAISRNSFRGSLLAILGLALIGVGLSIDANAAEGCSSQTQKTSDGAYAGCHIKMGNREFEVGTAQSSAEGCTQVCGILSEVNGPRTHSEKTANADTAIRARN